MTKCDLQEFLSIETIDISGMIFHDKNELFVYMAEMLFQAGCINDKHIFMKALYERENTGATYMGNGLAIPHGKSVSVIRPAAAFCRCTPFQYDEEESETANLVLMLAIPETTKQKEYIGMLAEISMLFLDEEFLKVIRHEKDKKIILDLFYDRLLNQ